MNEGNWETSYYSCFFHISYSAFRFISTLTSLFKFPTCQFGEDLGKSKSFLRNISSKGSFSLRFSCVSPVFSSTLSSKMFLALFFPTLPTYLSNILLSISSLFLFLIPLFIFHTYKALLLLTCLITPSASDLPTHNIWIYFLLEKKSLYHIHSLLSSHNHCFSSILIIPYPL